VCAATKTSKKSAVTRRRQWWERRGEGRGCDGEWMKPPTARLDDIYWMKNGIKSCFLDL
jgi:hypothetical protein